MLFMFPYSVSKETFVIEKLYEINEFNESLGNALNEEVNGQT